MAELAKNPMPAFESEWKRIVAQKDKSDENKAGYFKIGTVELTIPPTQIAVNDIKNNFTYQTMRSKGDITFQSGHTSKIIELDIVFHNLDEINNKLRPLIAQLKCSPFTPIYSPYLKSVLIPDGVDTEVYTDKEHLLKKDKEKEKVEDLVSKMGFVDGEKDKHKAQMKEEIYKRDSLSTDFKARMALFIDDNLNPSDVGLIDINKTVSENVQAELSASGGSAAMETGPKSLVNTLKDIEDKIESLSYEKKAYFKELAPNQTEHGNLACVLSQLIISTMPGLPECLSCHITFFVFNYHPFSQKFYFLNNRNEAVADMGECEYFVKWYTSRFMSDAPGSVISLENEPSTLVSFETIRRDRVTDKEGKKVDLGTILRINSDNYNSAECVSISVAISNKIRMLPILSWGVPTCQYLGSDSSEVSIVFNSFPEKDINQDVFLESLKYLFDQVDASSRNSMKDYRQNWATINNNIVNFMGIKDLILQSFDVNTVPGSPGMSNIALKFIDVNTSQLDREKIILKKAVTEERLEAFFNDEIAKKRRGERNLIDDVFLQKDAINQATLDYNKFQLDSLVPKISIDPDAKRYFKSAAKLSGYNIKEVDHNSKEVKDYSEEQKTRNKLFGTMSELVRNGRMAIRSMVFDELWYKPSKNPKATYEPINQEVKNKMKKDIRDALQDKPSDEIPKVYKMMLIRTPYAAEVTRDWSNKLKDYDMGRSNPPDSVLKAMRNNSADKWQDLVNIVYPDMDLPRYIDVSSCPKPTYRDLGVPVYLGQNDTTEARDDYDVVEPDFYFENIKIKDRTSTLETEEGQVRISFDERVSRANADHLSEGGKVARDVVNYIDNEVISESKDEEIILNDQPSDITGSIVDRSEFAKGKIDLMELGSGKKAKVKIIRVIDGDTVVAEGIGRVRLIGIDTPEKGENGYEEAKKFMEDTIGGKEVLLSVDVLGLKDKHRDKYDRALAYVEIDGHDLGEQIIERGLGTVYDKFNFSKIRRYIDAGEFNYSARGYSVDPGELDEIQKTMQDQ